MTLSAELTEARGGKIPLGDVQEGDRIRAKFLKRELVHDPDSFRAVGYSYAHMAQTDSTGSWEDATKEREFVVLKKVPGHTRQGKHGDIETVVMWLDGGYYYDKGFWGRDHEVHLLVKVQDAKASKKVKVVGKGMSAAMQPDKAMRKKIQADEKRRDRNWKRSKAGRDDASLAKFLRLGRR